MKDAAKRTLGERQQVVYLEPPCPRCQGINLHKHGCPKFHRLQLGRLGAKGFRPSMKGVPK